jgi:hypothetical protein
MSGFAFFRFMSENMLTSEKQPDTVEVTEDVLQGKGIKCDKIE